MMMEITCWASIDWFFDFRAHFYCSRRDCNTLNLDCWFVRIYLVRLRWWWSARARYQCLHYWRGWWSSCSSFYCSVVVVDATSPITPHRNPYPTTLRWWTCRRVASLWEGSSIYDWCEVPRHSSEDDSITPLLARCWNWSSLRYRWVYLSRGYPLVTETRSPCAWGLLFRSCSRRNACSSGNWVPMRNLRYLPIRSAGHSSRPRWCACSGKWRTHCRGWGSGDLPIATRSELIISVSCGQAGRRRSGYVEWRRWGTSWSNWSRSTQWP